ncbi:hypothetical protein [Kamptonema formosum]|uniref:hypothetical protein n=1 Tax=Kamptonema formosum TaxID=331992 RepID=UPI000372F8B3|nr:hypothetical protein [Oscillatoria sp. PCC 10802]
MKNYTNILVGFPITFIAMAAVSGGVSAAAGILFASVICTAGISLALWLPLWWVVGFAITGIYSLIAQLAGWQRIEVPITVANMTVSFTSEQIALANYTRDARAKGLSDTQIASRLTAQGWTNEEIEVAQQIVSERQ